MLNSWSAKNRLHDLEAAAGKEYSVIIVGGGITGAGIARECALRGISFCLLDKNDFASGTSSRSSKLFHGGMRYLASGEFGLVRESTSERNWLLHHFPNLVRPLGFVYPAYQKGKARPFMVWLAVKLYDIISDCFSEFKNYRKSRILKATFVEEFEPEITLEDPDLDKMVMAGFYYDTNCDDARVTLEAIKESLSSSKGASTALNYTRVEKFIHDSSEKVRGVKAVDVFTGRQFNIKGKVVVSAAGIWTDSVLNQAKYSEQRIYPTKGVHVVVPNERLGNRNALSLISFDDGRFFFVLHRGELSIIGTTDTAYYEESKNLDEPWCNKVDCDYLLRTVNRMFPQAMLTYDDIVSTFAGIRPLIRQKGAEHESDVSRRHEIFETADGVVAIAGGKSTIHRRMAEDLLFYLVDRGFLNKFSKPEYSKKGFSKQPFRISLQAEEFYSAVKESKLEGLVQTDQLQHLHQQYGQGGLAILEAVKDKPEKGYPLLENYPFCEAELDYILKREYAPKLIDVMCRRTEAQWTVWHYLQPELAAAVADIMAVYYGWSKDEKIAQLKEYLNYVHNTVRFIKDA